MTTKTHSQVHETVRGHYAKVATAGASCCGSGCGSHYSEDEVRSAPEGADLGLGCGNPQAIAALREGETVLDLGSGAGFDCFLAARQVGPKGRVIGVDMTPEMLARARANAEKGGFDNVEFRLGHIESLPVADRTADVVISNCVVNLSPDKPAAFREALRVLRPGGRLAIMDVVLVAPLPPHMKDSVAECVAGAVSPEEIERTLREVGFEDVRVAVRPSSDGPVASASIEAVRPRGGGCCGTTSGAPCC
jgi:SAM-dependent methyltransferase